MGETWLVRSRRENVVQDMRAAFDLLEKELLAHTIYLAAAA